MHVHMHCCPETKLKVHPKKYASCVASLWLVCTCTLYILLSLALVAVRKFMVTNLQWLTLVLLNKYSKVLQKVEPTTQGCRNRSGRSVDYRNKVWQTNPHKNSSFTLAVVFEKVTVWETKYAKLLTLSCESPDLAFFYTLVITAM